MSAGMVLTVFAIVITVAEVALGLALVILLFRPAYGDRGPHRLAEGMTPTGFPRTHRAPRPRGVFCCWRSSRRFGGSGRPRRSCRSPGALTSFAAAVTRGAALRSAQSHHALWTWLPERQAPAPPSACLPTAVDVMLVLVTLVLFSCRRIRSDT
jgi:hypothetical protein